MVGSRALASLAHRSRLVPLVVTLDDRFDYLRALGDADEGKLAPLVSLMGGLQRKCFLGSLSIAEGT